jgi:hypothetical protein
MTNDDGRTSTSSTEPTEYFDLPEVTPTTRSFDPETIRRQNQANQALKEKLQLEQQIKRLQKQLKEHEQRAETASTSRATDHTPRPVRRRLPGSPKTGK